MHGLVVGELQCGAAARCARVTLVVADRELPLPAPAGTTA